MFKPKTFIELCYAMQTLATVQIDQRIGKINGISAEDEQSFFGNERKSVSSGRCWNVSLVNADGDEQTIFFRE